MIINLNFESETPIYLQLRNQVVKGIAMGLLRCGESLPTVRQMADDSGINPMTVNKAYNLLKQEGLIVIDRRHGAKVVSQLPRKDQLSEAMEEALALFLCEAKLTGISESEILDKVSKLYRQLV